MKRKVARKLARYARSDLHIATTEGVEDILDGVLRQGRSPDDERTTDEEPRRQWQRAAISQCDATRD